MKQRLAELLRKHQLKSQFGLVKQQEGLITNCKSQIIGKIISNNYQKHRVQGLKPEIAAQGQIKYPNQDKIPLYASSVAEVKQIVKLSLGVYLHFLHCIHVRERLYCYCKYQGCHWKILYTDQLQRKQYLATKGVHDFDVEKGKQVVLKKSYLIHNHQLTTNSTNIKKYYQTLKRTNRDRPINQFISTIKTQVGIDMGRISNKTFAKQKINKVKKDQGLCNLIKAFYKNQIDYYMFPSLTNQQIIEKQLSEQFYMPDVVVFANANFKQLYRKYGQFIRLIQFEDYKYFQTYSSEEQQTSNQLRRLYMHLAVFIGTDCNDYHTIYGFALYYQMNSEVYFRLFQAFFELMQQHIVTQTIITPFKNQINQGIQKFRDKANFQFYYLYDFNSLTKQFEVIEYKSKRMLLELMVEKDEQIVNKTIEYLISDDQFTRDAISQFRYSMVTESSRIQTVNKIKMVAPKCFFTKIPNTFVGLYRHSNHELTGLFVKIIQNAPKKYNDLKWSSFISQLINQLQLYIANKQDNVRLADRALKELFPAFQLREFYQFLLQKYYESLEMNFIQDESFTPTKKITHKWKMQSNEEIIIYFKKHKWVCSCGQSFKTGLPCSHQIYGAIQASQKLIEYVHPRWVIPSELYKKCLQSKNKSSINK